MVRTYKHRRVWSYRRPDEAWTPDGPAPIAGSEVVVAVIEDGPRRRYELVLSDSSATAQVRSLTVHNGDVTPARLREVPLGDLRDAALGHLQQIGAELSDGLDTRSAHALATREPGEVSVSGDPSTAEFARLWEATPGRVIDPTTGQAVGRRQALAERFGVTVWAIDKWARKAREAGLITHKARAGRPRKNPTQEGK